MCISLSLPFHLLPALKRNWWLQIRTVRTFYSHQFPDGCVSIFPSVVVAVAIAIDSTRTPFIHSLRFFISLSSPSMAFIVLILHRHLVRRPVIRIFVPTLFFYKKCITLIFTIFRSCFLPSTATSRILNSLSQWFLLINTNYQKQQQQNLLAKKMVFHSNSIMKWM